MTEFFTEQYDVMVTYGPIITILGFLGFYGMTIYSLHKSGEGSKITRYSFLLLFFALLPNFFAHLSLAVVHGAWSPFVAEVVNITPVVYLLIVNEIFLKRNN